MKRVKLLVMKAVVVVGVLTWSAFAGANPPGTTLTADQALQKLLDGNKLYVKGDLKSLTYASTIAARTSLATGQKPYAIVLACSDSRVPPEILFDKGLGEVFVIRIAGNVIAPHELGSIDYAIEHLGAPLIMVLGHERCGAVTAAVDTPGVVEGNIGSLIESIRPAVDKALAYSGSATHAELVEASANENIKLVAANLKLQSSIVSSTVAAGTVKIVGAKYDLDDGVVRLMPLQ